MNYVRWNLKAWRRLSGPIGDGSVHGKDYMNELELSSLNEYLKSTRNLGFKIENRSNYRDQRPAFLNRISV